MPAKRKIVNVPAWLPDPNKEPDTANVFKLGEMLLAHVKKSLGENFAKEPPLPIGKKGWSAPFHLEHAKKALKQTGCYQCAMNLFTLKLNDREAAVNWRNVVFLAEY